MSKVCINGSFMVEGEFSFSIDYDTTKNPPLMTIEGQFKTASGYLPEINTIENERYLLSGIRVYQEAFGSEEDYVLYSFTAKAFGMADNLKEVKYVG